MSVATREFGQNVSTLSWAVESQIFEYKFTFKTIDVDLTCEMMRARAAQDIVNPAIKGWDFPLVRERMMTVDITGVIPALDTSDDTYQGLFESAMDWSLNRSSAEYVFTITTAYISIHGPAIAESTGLDYGGEAGEGRLRIIFSGMPGFG